ncbi:MAG: glycosyl transferase group 1 [uncultured bacterium]|nr:MAG: glycosyl transferase group 1 [uncultured bacterium]
MKVGIIVGGFDPQKGGSCTFQATIFEALKNISSKHTLNFYFINGDSELNEQKHSILKSVTESIAYKISRNLLGFHNKITMNLSPLNKQLLRDKIDFAWFLSPEHYEPLEIPFAFTVWDLEHRKHPFFPEVGLYRRSFDIKLEWDYREEFYRSILPRAAYVIAGTAAGVSEIIDFYSVHPARVKKIPFPTPDLKRYLSDRNNADVLKKFNIVRPYLFYPAQFWPHKNHISALMALKAAREVHGIDIDIVFTGSDKGNRNFIINKTCEFGLKEHVHFPGFVANDELAQLYHNAFALIFLSFFGPDNVPPLEAFLLKCPVIASALNVDQEQLKECALMVDPCNVTEIANAIKTINDDKRLREELIAKGFQRALSLSPASYVNEMFRLMDEFAAYRRCW